MLEAVSEKNEPSPKTNEDFVFYVMVTIDEKNTNFPNPEIGVCSIERLDEVTIQKIISAIETRNQAEPFNQGSVDRKDWKVYLAGNTQDIESSRRKVVKSAERYPCRNAQELDEESPFLCKSRSVVVDVKRASLDTLRVPSPSSYLDA